jgi:hypothetical protein
MAVTTANRLLTISILFNAFVVGGVLMGFEMLGSRYLFPYFVGGAVVGRYPSSRVIAGAILLAAIYLALVPATADLVMSQILNSIGDGPSAILLAAAALLLVPLSLLGMFSPVAVRLLTRSAEESGGVAGLVYGISTIGNVVGTLITTFALIPTIGSRSITYLYAAALAVCSGILLLPTGKPSS